nr:DNA-directed DNA polymerase [Tanacetum cinerariifolium]
MQTRSSSRLVSDQISNPTSSTNPNPKGHNRRRSKQRIENSNLEEHSHPVVMMANQRTMVELLRAPTEGYAEAIVVPSILAEQFELKHSLINKMTTDQFFGLENENPHDHIRWGSATTNLRNEISNFQQRFDESFHEAWDRYKDLFHAWPHHSFTELHQLDTFYNALNPADQDSLNAVAGGNLLERSTQDMLTIIENKSKVRNSRRKPVVFQVKACYVNSNSSEICKLTHAVNQQTSAVTTAMTAMLKQFQATPPPAPVKAVEETCVTCGGAHLYYQCLTVGGNTFLEFRDNIQGYVSAAAINYNQGNPGYRPLRFNRGNEQSYQAPAPQNQNVHLNELEKVRRMNEANMKAMQTQIDMVKNELINEMKSSFKTSLSNQTNEIKNMMASLLQMNTASTSGSRSLPSNTVATQRVNSKPLPLAVVLLLMDLPFPLLPNPLIRSKLKCKAIADLGASINLIPLSVWKKLGLPELISTRMTLELSNRAICTPVGISRDVFISVGKFTFPTDFVIVDYESDPRVLLILERPFLRTARALIDVHGEKMILRDDDERLTLNMRHDTSSYSNQPQKESINLINVFNNSNEDFLKAPFPNQPSGNPTFSPHPELTSLEVNNDIFDSEGCNEFADELPLEYDDNLPFDIESDLKEIEFMLYQDKDSSLKDLIDQKDFANLANIFVDSIPEMFADEHALDYSSPLGEKIKESKLLIDELDILRDFHPPSEYDSSISQDFSRVDALLSTNNEDKIFNPEVPKSKMLLPFSSENEEKVFKSGIHTSKKFIRILSQNYLIKAIKFSKSTRFAKA